MIEYRKDNMHEDVACEYFHPIITTLDGLNSSSSKWQVTSSMNLRDASSLSVPTVSRKLSKE